MKRSVFFFLLLGHTVWAASGSMWNSSFNQGVTEYLTGEWDASTGGALSLSCRDDQLSIAAQIAGKAPPGGSELVLTTSSSGGSHEHRYSTNAGGSVDMAAVASAPFWARLRADDIVTLRYGNGQMVVLSLAGASRTLPAKPCG